MEEQLKLIKSLLADSYNSLPNDHVIPGGANIPMSVAQVRGVITRVINVVDSLMEKKDFTPAQNEEIVQFVAGANHFSNYLVPNFILNSSTSSKFQIPVIIFLNNMLNVLTEMNPIWSKIEDPQVLPSKLVDRLAVANGLINKIEPEISLIDSKLKLIEKIKTISDTFPSELQEALDFGENVKKVSQQAQSEADFIENKRNEVIDYIDKIKVDGSTFIESLNGNAAEAKEYVDKLSEYHHVGTSQALAGAFSSKAKNLNHSMYGWGVVLIISLGFALFVGNARFLTLIELINNKSPDYQIWLMSAFSLFGVGAPIWVAWIATKQIGQRFRLAEDYAYKASISVAYEGYKRQAQGFKDELFEAKLFGTALDRLDEIPLRLIEKETYGSPMHEFFNSKIVKEQIESSSDFKSAVVNFLKRINSKNNL